MSNRGAIDLVVIEDHPVMRQGLEVLLERRGFNVLGSAATALEGERLLSEHSPDVAVIDLNLPDEPGLCLTRRLHARMPFLPILIYTATEDAAMLADALKSGAQGIVLKLGSLQELIDALRAVRCGNRYVDPRIRTLLEVQKAKPVLTARERQIFGRMAQGLNGTEIADELGISHETERTHVRNAMRKLDARTRTEAVVRALERRELAL
jgi:DNA-binding NarL/FixJ family response regulator